MRHRNKVKKLGRTASHRKATLKNMASALIEHRQIKTTLTRAKAARSYVERLISYGKTDTVHARRLAFKFLQSRTLVKMLFDEIAPAFEGRNGGYTRVIKLGQRRGDSASMAVLQLVGFEQLIVDDSASKPKARTTAKKKTVAKAAAATTAVVGKAAAEVKEAVEATGENAGEVAEAVEEVKEDLQADAAEEANDDEAGKADDKETKKDE